MGPLLSRKRTDDRLGNVVNRHDPADLESNVRREDEKSSRLPKRSPERVSRSSSVLMEAVDQLDEPVHLGYMNVLTCCGEGVHFIGP